MLPAFFNCRPLFDNWWIDCNMDCFVNTINKKITMATNLVNFGQVTSEIMWLICMGSEYL